MLLHVFCNVLCVMQSRLAPWKCCFPAKAEVNASLQQGVISQFWCSLPTWKLFKHQVRLSSGIFLDFLVLKMPPHSQIYNHLLLLLIKRRRIPVIWLVLCRAALSIYNGCAWNLGVAKLTDGLYSQAENGNEALCWLVWGHRVDGRHDDFRDAPGEGPVRNDVDLSISLHSAGASSETGVFTGYTFNDNAVPRFLVSVLILGAALQFSINISSLCLLIKY